MGILCCCTDLTGKQSTFIQNEASNFIRFKLEVLNIRNLMFRNVVKILLGDDIEEIDLELKIKIRDKVDYKHLMKVEKTSFYEPNPQVNPYYKFHQNIFSVLSFTLIDKTEPTVNTSRILSYLLAFTADPLKEKVKYFILLNQKNILGSSEEGLSTMAKKENLKTILMKYLTFFIKTLTNCFSSIVQENIEEYQHVVLDLNILLAMCSDNKLELFFEGFIQDDVDELVENFDENDLKSFFMKNYYLFDINDLRNNYFNLKKY
jgi:hypothetical protein